MSYAELNSRANRLAHALRALGVGRETLVALYLERDIECVVAMLGVLKAGGAFVPLDPAAPRERLELLLADSSVPIIVTSRLLAARITPEDGRRLCVLDDVSEASACANLEGSATAECAAYVIYTSGSTGTPKGVVVEHRNVARLFTATERWFDFGSKDVWTLFHSFGFDFSVWELWGALLYGGRVVIVSSETAHSPRKLLELMQRERVTVLNQTPSAFQQLARAEALAVPAIDLSLRYIVFGGEALTANSLGDWVKRHGVASPSLVNMYGITETTVHVTYRLVSSSDIAAGGAIPIGVPISDLQVRLLDDSGEPVAKGSVGEIYVGGAGVARGYLNRPDLTPQRFLRDRQSANPDARLYRSGDLAKELPDGTLVFVGRADAQLKIRGYRIEPGEVESCIRQHPGVANVLVIGRDNGDGDKALVAYVVSAAKQASLIEEIRTLVNRQLPEHLCPSSYVEVDEFPLTSNGKVDVAQLPFAGQSSSRRAGAPERRAPITKMEKTLADIWQKVLRVQRVALDDDFFELGGTSLGAVKVLLSIREQIGISLDMSLWADVSTVAGFAGACSALRHATTRAPASLETSISSGEMQ